MVEHKAGQVDGPDGLEGVEHAATSREVSVERDPAGYDRDGGESRASDDPYDGELILPTSKASRPRDKNQRPSSAGFSTHTRSSAGKGYYS